MNRVYTLVIRCSGSDGKPCRHDAVHTIESDKRITVVTPEGWHHFHRRPRCPECTIDHLATKKAERMRRGPYWVCPHCLHIGNPPRPSHALQFCHFKPKSEYYFHKFSVPYGESKKPHWCAETTDDSELVGPFADIDEISAALQEIYDEIKETYENAEWYRYREGTRKEKTARELYDFNYDNKLLEALRTKLAQLKLDEEAKEASQ